MTLKVMKKRVEDIKAERGDAETAHILDDRLRADFIRYIARTGTKEQRAIAKGVLSTDEIEFARWYA